MPTTISTINLPCHAIKLLLYFFMHIAAATAKSLQLCLTPGNPIDGSAPGSPIPGILQARKLEWVV